MSEEFELAWKELMRGLEAQIEKSESCKKECQYCKDIDMPGHSCFGKCVYMERREKDEKRIEASGDSNRT
jgi:hypothetical protein